MMKKYEIYNRNTFELLAIIKAENKDKANEWAKERYGDNFIVEEVRMG